MNEEEARQRCFFTSLASPLAHVSGSSNSNTASFIQSPTLHLPHPGQKFSSLPSPCSPSTPSSSPCRISNHPTFDLQLFTLGENAHHRSVPTMKSASAGFGEEGRGGRMQVVEISGERRVRE